MKKSSFLFLLSLLFVVSTAQAQNYNPQKDSDYGSTSGPDYSSNSSQEYGSNYGPEGESGKCYAQCLIPGDTVKTTETIEVKPGYIEPFVVEGYPRKEKVNYIVKEACSTCEFEVEKYTNTREEIVVKEPGYWEYFTSPCEYKTVYDTIVTKEASVKYKIIPPEFEVEVKMFANGGTIEEGRCTPAVIRKEIRTVEIEEACVDIEVADYIFEDEEFTIEVQAASKKWVRRKSEGNCLSSNPDDCLVWCLEDLPAVTEKCIRKVKKGCPYGFEDNGEFCVKETYIPAKTKEYEVEICEEEAKFEKAVLIVDNFEEVPVTVLKKPAEYIKIVEKAEYEVIERQVLVKPATLDSIYHDPVIDTLIFTFEGQKVTGGIIETPPVVESCEMLLCTKPEIKTKDHGPVYKNVTKVKIKAGEFTEWREVLCPADIDGYTIGLIQHALREKGYDPGPNDNLIGDKTKTALTQYQKDNNLPIGQLDLKTLKALGIKN